MLMRRAGAKRSALEPNSFTHASQCSLAKTGRAVPSCSEATVVRRAEQSRINASAALGSMVTWRTKARPKARFASFAPEGVQPRDWPDADWAEPVVTNWAEPVVDDCEDAIAGGNGANAKEHKTNGSLMQRAVGWSIWLAGGVAEKWCKPC